MIYGGNALRSDAFWIAAGRIGNALILIASLRVLTALLVPEEYALLALLTAFQSFAGLILINPVGQYVSRHTHEWDDDGSLTMRLKTLAHYWLASGWVTGMLSAVWFASMRPSRFPLEYIFVGLVVWLTIFAITQQGVAVSRLNMLGFRRKSVQWQLASTALGLMLSSVFVLAMPSALAWLMGQGLGTWVGYLGAKRALSSADSIAPATCDVSLKTLFSRPDFHKFCLPLVVVTSLLWVEGNGYRFILERVWTPTTFAFFVLGLSVPAQMSALLESVVMQLVYPYFFRSVSGEVDSTQKCRAVSNMINALLPLYLLWVAFLIVGSPYALRLVADPKYEGATAWLTFGALLELARLTGTVWLLVAQAEKDFSPAIGPFAISVLAILCAVVGAVAFDLPPVIFAAMLVGALFIKTAAIVLAMRAKMPIYIASRRLAVAASILLLIGFASKQFPVDVSPLTALVLLALSFIAIAIPIAIHIKTSTAVKYIFSFSLRNER